MSRLIGVIDAGTNKIVFTVYKTPNFEEIVSHEVRIKQISPKEGWLEHDPMEIIDAVRECSKVALHLLPNQGYSKSDVTCIGVTNQRETVMMWNKQTGEPLYNAIGKSN
jgi:glycerol kinase